MNDRDRPGRRDQPRTGVGPLDGRFVVRTVEEGVFETLRDSIVRGELAPETPLRLLPLAQSLGVSTTPVRGALDRLQHEGLVHQRPHRATIVAPLDQQDLAEIQAIRLGLEGIAARLGAPNLTDDDVRGMERLLADGRVWAAQHDLDEYVDFIWNLHAIPYAATGRGQLFELIHEYELRAQRYIRIAVGSRFGFEQSIQHQEAWVEACRARDGDAAERVIRVALDWTIVHLDGRLSRPARKASRASVGKLIQESGT